MKLKLLLFFCLIPTYLYSQGSTGNLIYWRYVGTVDSFINQPCGPADIAFATDVLPGQNLFFCPNQNVWTQMITTSGNFTNWVVVGVGPKSLAPATCTAQRDAYLTSDTQEILYCFSKDVFTALSAQSSCPNCAFINAPNVYVGDWLQDFSLAELALPSHPADPAACQPGQLEFNAVAGTVKYCSAPNIWSTLTVGSVISGTATFLPKFTSPTTLGNSHVTDDGVTVRSASNVSLQQNALLTQYPNSASGTVAYTLTKLDNSGNAIQTLTTDTTAIYGVCVIGCAPSGTSPTALLAVAGQVQCLFDNQTVVRDFVIASSGVNGDCHDAGSVEPTGVQVIGRVVNLNAGAGSTATIALFSPDTVAASAPPVTFTIANANPGTVLNEIVKLALSSPATATAPGTADISGAIGICSGGCGNSGTATILQSGAALCVFDGSTASGDYVQISSANAGQCHDAGGTYPVPNQVIGRVTSTNIGAGTYGILVFPPESSNPATATIAPGTINDITKYTGPESLGPSGVTIDSANNVATPASMTTGVGGAFSGSIVFNGHTSGGQGLGVLDAAGSAILYILPATPTTGDVLQDTGVITCPTLPAGAPSVCHQLGWTAAGGAGSVSGFSAGTLSPVFTTSVATPTTTPVLSFILTNAAAGTVFGNNTSSAAGPVYTAVPVLGVDATTAGTLQMANGAGGGAHTIWASGATTSNTVAGPATAPVTGDLLSCTTSGTVCTLADSGVLAANVVTAASNFATGAVVQAAGANKTLASATGHGIALPLLCATSSNSGTAEVCNTSPTFTPVAGDSITFQADIANTGAFTLNVNSLGAKGVKKNGTVALVANDILATPFQVILTYDGTNWEMQGEIGNTPTAGTVTSVATTSPVTGGTFTGSGTIGCATCYVGTPTNHDVMVMATSQSVTAVPPGTTGYILTSNGPSSDPSFQAAAAIAVAQTRRTCVIDNDTQSATALTAAQFSGHCVVPFAATIVEVDVSGGTQVLTGSAAAPTFTGTSSIQIGKHGVTNNTALLSGALATVSGVACALTSTGGTCLFDNGLTSSGSITIATTSISAGDELYVSAATADAAQTWYNVTIVYTVN